MNDAHDGADLVSQWRNEADDSNPAGPLFVGGDFAEADIACETSNFSGRCGTGCTYSRTRYCC